MPTGYTAALYEGKDVSFQEFAQTCLSAFVFANADGTFTKNIDEQIQYIKNIINKNNEDIQKLLTLSDEDLDVLAQEEYDAEKTNLENSLSKVKSIKDRYENMLVEVEKWEPPTSNHVDFKNFMIDQLKNSIEFDCKVDYYEERLRNIRRLSSDEYRESTLDERYNSTKFFMNELQDVSSKTRENNVWVSDVLDSLD